MRGSVGLSNMNYSSKNLKSTRAIIKHVLFKAFEYMAFHIHKPRIICVFGLKRSGNHLIINWILSQYEGSSLFYNHCRPDVAPIARDRRELRLKKLWKAPLVVFSYEDRDPLSTLVGPLGQFIEMQRPGLKSVDTCILLRDPKNFFASRFKKWPEEASDIPRRESLVRKYKMYANLFESFDTLTHSDRKIGINYNYFVLSCVYREELAANLNIPNGVKGLDEVPQYGRGSSFDGTDKQGRAREMTVFERWRSFEGDPQFDAVVNNPQIVAIDARLFTARDAHVMAPHA